MQENLLYKLWKEYALSGQLICWKENALKILDGGVLNIHNGPDIKHARFEFNGAVYQGSVEFHVTLKDWYKHHHHNDPQYQDVLLHIVGQETKRMVNVVHKISQKEIPTFLLPVRKLQRKTTNCLPQKNLNPNKLEQQLQSLALKRLDEKILEFRKELKTHSVEKIFYHKFLRALGYPCNKNSFEMLACKVPPEIYQKEKDNHTVLMALYFGSAGFLNGPFTDSYALSLKKVFSTVCSILSFSSLNIGQWQFSANRYTNHPHFRLAAWVALLTSTKEISPFQTIYALLEQREEPSRLIENIMEMIVQKADGYWKGHYALQRSLKSRSNSVFISKLRAKEIIINLIIPLTTALAYRNNNHGFIEYLKSVYLFIPGVPSYSGLRRRKKQFEECQKIWPTFAVGQAFLHLDKNYCQNGDCKACPIKYSPLIEK